MAFVATLTPESALQPQYEGANKVEHWDATAGAADTGPVTVTARYLTKVTDFELEFYGGTGPLSTLMTANMLLLYLPGTTTATTYRITLKGRYA